MPLNLKDYRQSISIQSEVIKKPVAQYANLIHLRERNFIMLKKDLILRNPLRHLEDESSVILPKGGFGAVVARAGVGKTAFLVQLALNRLLNNQNVLHISLNEPVGKVGLWYEEVVHHLTDLYSLKNVDLLWEAILQNRFIMTFKTGGFNEEVLDERLTELSEQNIFMPQLILIDGFPFETTGAKSLEALKKLIAAHGARAWFTARTHRAKDNQNSKSNSTIADFDSLFECIIALKPQGQDIHVDVLKSVREVSNQPGLTLDPTTMLIKEL